MLQIVETIVVCVSGYAIVVLFIGHALFTGEKLKTKKKALGQPDYWIHHRAIQNTTAKLTKYAVVTVLFFPYILLLSIFD